MFANLLRGCRQRVGWRPMTQRYFCLNLVYKDDYVERLRKSFNAEERGSKLLLPTYKKAMLYPDDLAIRDNVGEFTYFQLYMTAKRLSIQISNICGSGASLPVGFFCANDAMWIVMLWSCWMSGQVAVPLRTSPSLELLRLQAIDCKAKLFLGTPENASIVDELAQTLKAATIVLDHDFVPPVKEISSTSMYAQQLVVSRESGVLMPEAMLPNDFYENSIAMLLYTSTSTSTSDESHTPKPVLLTHRNVDDQIRCLINTWRLGPSDTLLPVLPMVHMHIAIGAVLDVGGNVVLEPSCNASSIWNSLLGVNLSSKKRCTCFLAKPIVYKQLIAEYQKMFLKDEHMVEYIKKHCSEKMRLMATGFALLPDSVFNYWRDITGHHILEYYGTLETGLVLGHTIEEGPKELPKLVPEKGVPKPTARFVSSNYKPRTLGSPLQGVTARLMGPTGEEIFKCQNHGAGPVKTGPLSEASSIPVRNFDPAKAAVQGGLEISCRRLSGEELPAGMEVEEIFIPTGDICAYYNDNFYFISKACDVITVGGIQVNASEVKKLLLSHPKINDVAILAIPDSVWGNRLCVVCIVSPDVQIELETIETYCHEHLPPFKCPHVVKLLHVN
ncbi:malonate--CoA ligase ACSF3, mitochondrial-like isoform X1 [Drosophila pseudoobscura]|uniref:Malonate--CoA ligase ACSF3, mitochondrial-like isoform X1 n=1 Tax=Drosophila pseudoobscura pseudoobscura TaxID=46245 RepID=B5DIR4_DROPS|nr:malonate--CoA ligase ACSF3, mitochondrial isoform X1 [Drosophila pseudoobscura]